MKPAEKDQRISFAKEEIAEWFEEFSVNPHAFQESTRFPTANISRLLVTVAFDLTKIFVFKHLPNNCQHKPNLLFDKLH